jgi:hypothetical protein
MVRLPAPFDSDPEDFSAVVSMTRELMDTGKVRLRASPAANISFHVTAADVNAVAEKYGIRPPEARAILREISAIASLIVRGRFDNYINDLIDRPSSTSVHRLTDEEKAEAKSVLHDKFRFVETELVTSRVRQKFHATRASKHEALLGVRWEVIERKYDRDEGEKGAGLLALLRFDVATRSEREIFPMFFSIDDSTRRSFLIECDEDDLENIIAILTEAKQRLAQERSA